ncbi:plasminogen-binding N-terminal domain-containing protein [Sulfurimonas sp. HSL1-6]|uniref:plasminogen-binding N-terminal domain-containing protein n=1 Tax=Thiomicrolovo immobilis TaxID=3131935 RepID=UPI0031F95A7F
MIKVFYILPLFLGFLHAGALHLSLESVSAENETGTIKTARVEPGVSGFVVRHFTPEHSAIIANAVAEQYDDAAGILTVAFSEYSGLQQNSLPRGEWQPHAGDEVILAFAYTRGVLIAPTRAAYFKLTEQLGSVDWMHPDTLATYLSYRGHPTPLKEDLAGFCTVATTGLLFLYLDDTLFTLDCQSLSLLQMTEAGLSYDKPQLPFYTRVEEIDANWFGSGSGRLDAYEPHYLELLVENNPHSQKLYDFIQSHPSADKQLLDEFDLKGQP